jgi:hypothetical protein
MNKLTQVFRQAMQKQREDNSYSAQVEAQSYYPQEANIRILARIEGSERDKVNILVETVAGLQEQIQYLTRLVQSQARQSSQAIELGQVTAEVVNQFLQEREGVERTGES